MRRRPAPPRMPLVEALLAMLHAHFPNFELRPDFESGFDFDHQEARWRQAPGWARAEPRRPPEPPTDPVLARLYSTLGLPYGSRLAVVRRAWRRLVSTNHPDRFATNPEMARAKTELVKQLNGACEELERRLAEPDR